MIKPPNPEHLYNLTDQIISKCASLWASVIIGLDPSVVFSPAWHLICLNCGGTGFGASITTGLFYLDNKASTTVLQIFPAGSDVLSRWQVL
jgi:hypothetical protein